MAQMSREDFMRLQSEDVFKKPVSTRKPEINNKPEIKRAENPADNTKKTGQSGGRGLNLLSMLNLKNFRIDADRSVVLAVLLLLSNESDELLLLALLYIIL